MLDFRYCDKCGKTLIGNDLCEEHEKDKIAKRDNDIKNLLISIFILLTTLVIIKGIICLT